METEHRHLSKKWHAVYMKLGKNVSLLVQYHIILDLVCAHACACVHVCDYIHTLYIYIAVILNVIQPKWPRGYQTSFFSPKNIFLWEAFSQTTTSLGGSEVLTDITAIKQSIKEVGEQVKSQPCFCSSEMHPDSKKNYLSLISWVEETSLQSFHIQHAFLIWGKTSQFKLIWLLDFVQYEQIVSSPLNLFCFNWATKSKFSIF